MAKKTHIKGGFEGTPSGHVTNQNRGHGGTAGSGGIKFNARQYADKAEPTPGTVMNGIGSIVDDDDDAAMRRRRRDG